jgi:two-component SAPR family response regulator
VPGGVAIPRKASVDRGKIVHLRDVPWFCGAYIAVEGSGSGSDTVSGSKHGVPSTIDKRAAGFSGGQNVASEAVRVWLLGGFRVSVGSREISERDWHLRKAASLAKLLALSPGHRLHREVVMDLLWPELGNRAAANNLRGAVHALRRALGPHSAGYISVRDGEIILCPDGRVWVDVDADRARPG